MALRFLSGEIDPESKRDVIGLLIPWFLILGDGLFHGSGKFLRLTFVFMLLMMKDGSDKGLLTLMKTFINGRFLVGFALTSVLAWKIFYGH